MHELESVAPRDGRGIVNSIVRTPDRAPATQRIQVATGIGRNVGL
jgi:hypothetical protein